MADRAGLGADDFLPRRLYRYELRLRALLDLRTHQARAAVGLTEADLEGAALGTSQSIGDAAHYVGREGVVAPSATGSGTVIAVFFDRLQAESHVRDLDFEVWQGPPEGTGAG